MPIYFGYRLPQNGIFYAGETLRCVFTFSNDEANEKLADGTAASAAGSATDSARTSPELKKPSNGSLHDQLLQLQLQHVAGRTIPQTRLKSYGISDAERMKQSAWFYNFSGYVTDTLGPLNGEAPAMSSDAIAAGWLSVTLANSNNSYLY